MRLLISTPAMALGFFIFWIFVYLCIHLLNERNNPQVREMDRAGRFAMEVIGSIAAAISMGFILFFFNMAVGR